MAAILILVRLPVDDLCRFLCVSKRWYNTISSPPSTSSTTTTIPSPPSREASSTTSSTPPCPPSAPSTSPNSRPSPAAAMNTSTPLASPRLSPLHDPRRQSAAPPCRHPQRCRPISRQGRPARAIPPLEPTHPAASRALPHPPPSNFPNCIVKLSIVDGACFLVVALHWKRAPPSAEIPAFYSDTGEWTTTSLSAGVLFPTGVNSLTLIGETLYWVDEDEEVSGFENFR